MAKGKYLGETDELIAINGNVYEIVAREKIGEDWYVYVIDEVGDCVMAYPENFVILEGSFDDLPMRESENA